MNRIFFVMIEQICKNRKASIRSYRSSLVKGCLEWKGRKHGVHDLDYNMMYLIDYWSPIKTSHSSSVYERIDRVLPDSLKVPSKKISHVQLFMISHYKKWRGMVLNARLLKRNGMAHFKCQLHLVIPRLLSTFYK